MPAIHIGGPGWSLARQWPEQAVSERWQEHLHSLLRGHLLCRELLIRADGQRVQRVFVDWSHPGIGRSRPPSWERTGGKNSATALAQFDVGDVTVSFLGGGVRRASNTAASVAIIVIAGAHTQVTCSLSLETPLRACAESAALSSAVCSAVLLIAETVASAPPSPDRAQSPAEGAVGGGIDGDAEVRAALGALEPFQAKVLELICLGWTNQEIATTTRMSIGSVRAATSAIYARLGVRNRHEAAALTSPHMRVAMRHAD